VHSIHELLLNDPLQARFGAGLLIDARHLGVVYVSALHPVNALLLLLTTLSLADIKAIFTR
jgi:hypothetical protein